MGIKGFQGTSLLDFPGRLAALVFFGGCNLLCPFCHNPLLVEAPDRLPDLDPEELFAELAGRRGFLDGLVASGGEPTLSPLLAPLLRGARDLGLATKLDTNGLRPQVLEALLAEGLVDYVALDVKTSLPRYGELGGEGTAAGGVAASARLLLDWDGEHELRTTCVPGLVGEEEIRELGRMVGGKRRWVLQGFVPGPALAPQLRELEPYPLGELERLAAVGREFVSRVELRGAV